MKHLIIFLLSCSLFILNAHAEEVTVVVRVHSLKEARDTLHYAIQLENEGLAMVLNSLRPSDEVIMKGDLEYQQTTIDGRTTMTPSFHVKKIVPVSLSKLGKVEFVPAEPARTFVMRPAFAPKTFPVNADVANTITMTATLLMLKDLSGAQKTQPMTDTLNTGLIFSAGVLMTGLYLWDQLHSSAKGGE